MVSSFDEKAYEWDKNSRRVQTAQKIARAIRECIPEKKYEILDFGSGTGLISYELKDLAKSILGVDTSPKMVKQFNQKSDSAKIRATTQPIVSIEGNFDLIVSSMAFHHVADIERLVEVLAKKLRDGGYLCVADLCKEDGTFHSDNTGVCHFGFDEDELISLFEKKGFKKICRKIPQTIRKHRAFPIFLLCLQKGS